MRISDVCTGRLKASDGLFLWYGRRGGSVVGNEKNKFQNNELRKRKFHFGERKTRKPLHIGSPKMPKHSVSRLRMVFSAVRGFAAMHDFYQLAIPSARTLTNVANFGVPFCVNPR